MIVDLQGADVDLMIFNLKAKEMVLEVVKLQHREREEVESLQGMNRRMKSS
tara:strand:+ start:323 stop:475 length:153 start_codon:yes stop_codon:yes gene_type:complete